VVALRPIDNAGAADGTSGSVSIDLGG